MVAPRPISLAIALMMLGTLAAQNYSTSDTTTLYPNKGTYYHDKFEGRKTASGEVFDQNRFTAAHWRIRLGTLILVTNQNTGLQVVVKVNDRCPKRGVIDLSHRASTAIGIKGCQPVTVRLLPSTEANMARWLAQEQQFDSVASKLNPRPTTQPTQQNTEDADAAVHYTLDLGIYPSHAEAYAAIEKLPPQLRDSVAISPMPDDSHLQLTLTATLTAAQYTNLQQTMPQIDVMDKN